MAIKFNDSKLKGRIYEKYGSILKLSRKLQLHPSVISSILSGRRKMNRADIVVLADALEIKLEEYNEYFFNQMS